MMFLDLLEFRNEFNEFYVKMRLIKYVYLKLRKTCILFLFLPGECGDVF